MPKLDIRDWPAAHAFLQKRETSKHAHNTIGKRYSPAIKRALHVILNRVFRCITSPVRLHINNFILISALQNISVACSVAELVTVLVPRAHFCLSLTCNSFAL
eukprot:scaffold8374_cov175-Amphora_coffeaeformis.AAC.62